MNYVTEYQCEGALSSCFELFRFARRESDDSTPEAENPFTSIICFHIMRVMEDQTELHIRPMFETDIDAILTIEQASFPIPWKREHFLHEVAALHSFPFVAEDGEIIVGYVCLMSLFEDAQILDIAVAQEQRGRGVARLLMDYAIAIARDKGAELLALEVRSTNSPAIALYEQCGFVRTAVRQKYYEGRDDALLMELKIC